MEASGGKDDCEHGKFVLNSANLSYFYIKPALSGKLPPDDD